MACWHQYQIPLSDSTMLQYLFIQVHRDGASFDLGWASRCVCVSMLVCCYVVPMRFLGHYVLPKPLCNQLWLTWSHLPSFEPCWFPHTFTHMQNAHSSKTQLIVDMLKYRVKYIFKWHADRLYCMLCYCAQEHYLC